MNEQRGKKRKLLTIKDVENFEYYDEKKGIHVKNIIYILDQ